MNIDTIKKYKNEFDHFVNGGKLLWARARDSKLSWLKATGNHQEFFNTNEEYYIYIIDDEYVEFRKALAEGKTIEYIGQSSNVWHEVQEPDFNLHPTCYRIKPDEPKFKVGDFVTPLNRKINCSVWQIDNILSCNTLVSGNTRLDPRIIQLWTPVKNEWCWFWDKCTPHRPTLRQYDIFPEGYGEENMFHDSEQNPFDFCEPFLNSRPSHLKD